MDLEGSEVFVDSASPEVLAEIGARPTAELFTVKVGYAVLRSPGGIPITHPDRRAMVELAGEVDFASKLDPADITLYGLYSTYADYLQKGPQQLDEEHHRLRILNDVVLRTCAGPEVVDQLKYVEIVSRELERHGLRYPHLAQTIGWHPEDFNDDDSGRNVRRIVDRYWDEYARLGGFEEAVYRSAMAVTESSILASMLVADRISSNEFALVTMAVHCIMSKTFGGIDRAEERAMKEELVSAAETMRRFLVRFNTEVSEVEAFSRLDEGIHLEFKSTLRWNLDGDCKDQNIELSTLKAITAFLNAEGGTLIIGMNDGGELVGIDRDGFESADKFTLHLRGLVSNHIGSEFLSLLRWRVVDWRRGRVCVIACRASTRPAYISWRGQKMFMVRCNNSSNRFTAEALDWYLKDHFGDEGHRTGRCSRPLAGA